MVGGEAETWGAKIPPKIQSWGLVPSRTGAPWPQSPSGLIYIPLNRLDSELETEWEPIAARQQIFNNYL